MKTVAHKIEEKILDGEIKVGEKLPSEINFSKMLGVSRNVLREALRVLKEWGLIEIKPGSGAYVCKPEFNSLQSNINRLVILNDVDIKEFFELRSLLEEQACLEAADSISKNELDILGATLSKMNEIEDPEKWGACELKFHLTIAKASRNKLLCIFYQFFDRSNARLF